MDLFQFMSDSPVLSFLLFLLMCMLIESVVKIIFKKGNSDD